MKTEVRRPVSDSRKIRKPLMEKKRRARINDSLETLKRILLDSKSTLKEGKNGPRTAKLEKADILEMTVQYLQNLHDKLHRLQEPPRKAPASNVSCSNNVGMRVALFPSKLPSGEIIFVVPSSYKSSKSERDKAKEGSESGMWRPW